MSCVKASTNRRAATRERALCGEEAVNHMGATAVSANDYVGVKTQLNPC